MADREEYVVAIRVEGDAQVRALMKQLEGMGPTTVRSANAAKQGVAGFGQSIKGLYATIAGSVVLWGVVKALKGVAGAAMEAEDASMRLDAALRLRGAGVGATKAQLQDIATQMSRVSTFSDEAVASAEAVLLRFSTIDGSNIEKMTKLVVDFAAATGKDAADAAVQLGRALEAPGEGLRALTQAGVVLLDSEREQIEALNDAGKTAEAQALIYEKLRGKVDGLGEAMASTTSGALAQMKNEAGELAEDLGSGLAPIIKEVAKMFTDWARDEDVKRAFRDIGVAIGQTTAAFIAAVSTMTKKFLSFMSDIEYGLGMAMEKAADIYGAFGDERNATRLRNVADKLMGLSVQHKAMSIVAGQLADHWTTVASKIGQAEAGSQKAGSIQRTAPGAKVDKDALKKHQEEMDRLRATFDPFTVQIEEMEAAVAALAKEMATGGAEAAEKYGASLRDAQHQLYVLKVAAGRVPYATARIEPFDLTNQTRTAADYFRESARAADELFDTMDGINVVAKDWRIDTELRRAAEDKAGEYLQDYQDRQRTVVSETRRLADLGKLFASYAKQWPAYAAQFNKAAAAAKFDSWILGARAVAEILGSINSQLGDVAHSLIDVAEAWQKMGTAAAMNDKMGTWEGAAGVVSGAYSILGSRMNAGGGTSQWGGRNEGNYQREGEAIGSTVGAIIGAVVTWAAGGAGAVVGAAIGKAIGGIIGHLIKTGADEGLASLEVVAGQLRAKIVKDERGLGGVLKGLGADINDAVQGILAEMGGTLIATQGMQLKIRGKNIRVFINGIIGEFQDMGKALDFAVTQLLKTAEFSGVSDNLRGVLQSGRLSSIEELQNVVGFIVGLERAASGLSDFGAEMQNFAVRMENAQRQLVAYGVAADEAARIAGMAAVNQFRAWADQITGRQKTRAEQMQEKAVEIEIYNAEKALYKARIAVQIADLKTQIALAKAAGTIAQQRQKINLWELGVETKLLRAKGLIVNYNIELMQRELEALMKVAAALDKLPDLNIGMVRLGGKKGKGGGGYTAGDSQTFWEMLHGRGGEAGVSALAPGERMAAAELRYRQILARAASGNREAKSQLDEVARTYLEIAQSYYGNTAAYDAIYKDVMSKLAKHGALTDKESRARQKAIDELFGLAAAAGVAASALGGGPVRRKRNKTAAAAAAAGAGTGLAAAMGGGGGAGYAAFYGGGGGGAYGPDVAGAVASGAQRQVEATEKVADELRQQRRERRRSGGVSPNLPNEDPTAPVPPPPIPGGGLGERMPRRLLRFKVPIE